MHSPPAQSIADLQKELKRYKKQEEKQPLGWRRVKIEELESRLIGLAKSQGWLKGDEKDFRASTLCTTCEGPATEESDSIDIEVHQPPSCKTCCISSCGCCPCPLCQDNYEVNEAQKDFDELRADVATNRNAILEMYTKKGMSLEAANAKIDSKLAKAEQKLKDAEAKMHDVQLKKFSSSMGVCQTAVTMPCMVGM